MSLLVDSTWLMKNIPELEDIFKTTCKRKKDFKKEQNIEGIQNYKRCNRYIMRILEKEKKNRSI